MRSSLLAWFVLITLGLIDDVAAQWKAGAAKVTITPEQLMWMSGYGGRDHAAEGKLTELWGKAVALEDPQGERAVLVTVDLVGIDRVTSEHVCAAAAERFKLRRDQIAINCSHTHCGPVVGHNLGAMYSFGAAERQRVDAYTRQLETKLIELIGAALKKLAPARLEYAEGTCDFAVNRRANKEADVPQLRAAAQLKGPVDHRVPVLAIKNAQGELMAVTFGYACHATVLSFYQWCADYPGFAMDAVERAHPGAIALFWAGCGADQNPLPRRQVELAQQYGERLAKSVEAVLGGKLNEVRGKLTTRYEEIPLRLDTLPTRAELLSQSQDKNNYIALRAKGLLAQIDAGTPLSPTYPYPVQVWHVGNELRWVVLGGEVVVDFALRLAKELGPRPTWIAGYSNDVMAYIPSLRVLKEGGYEGASAMIYYGLPTSWDSTVEESIVAKVHELAK